MEKVSEDQVYQEKGFMKEGPMSSDGGGRSMPPPPLQLTATAGGNTPPTSGSSKPVMQRMRSVAAAARRVGSRPTGRFPMGRPPLLGNGAGLGIGTGHQLAAPVAGGGAVPGVNPMMVPPQADFYSHYWEPGAGSPPAAGVAPTPVLPGAEASEAVDQDVVAPEVADAVAEGAVVAAPEGLDYAAGEGEEMLAEAPPTVSSPGAASSGGVPHGGGLFRPTQAALGPFRMSPALWAQFPPYAEAISIDTSSLEGKTNAELLKMEMSLAVKAELVKRIHADPKSVGELELEPEDARKFADKIRAGGHHEHLMVSLWQEHLKKGFTLNDIQGIVVPTRLLKFQKRKPDGSDWDPKEYGHGEGSESSMAHKELERLHREANSSGEVINNLEKWDRGDFVFADGNQQQYRLTPGAKDLMKPKYDAWRKGELNPEKKVKKAKD